MKMEAKACMGQVENASKVCPLASKLKFADATVILDWTDTLMILSI